MHEYTFMFTDLFTMCLVSNIYLKIYRCYVCRIKDFKKTKVVVIIRNGFIYFAELDYINQWDAKCYF